MKRWWRRQRSGGFSFVCGRCHTTTRYDTMEGCLVGARAHRCPIQEKKT